MLTNEKKTFFKLKNKVDLANKATFGYFSGEDPLNNELFVYLNTSLDGSSSISITNRNIGYDINEKIKLLWDDKLNPTNVNKFYDESIFAVDQVQFGKQPELTEYMEYKGNIFELYERLTQYTKPRVVREQEIKNRYIDWFDIDFLTMMGLERVSKYIFNLSQFSDKVMNDSRKLSTSALAYDFNEYIRTQSTSDLEDMFVMANSNSVRPSRIYYKKIKTETSLGNYESKFMFPLYLVNDIDVIKNITGLVVLRNAIVTSIRQSTSY